MASIKVRHFKYTISYNVIYYGIKENGKYGQIWETYKTMKDAIVRKREIESLNEKHDITCTNCKTIDDLMIEYVSIYGESHWGITTYSKNVATINNYIIPLIGKTKLRSISPMFLEKFYRNLLKQPGVINPATGKRNETISPGTIKEIHKILHSAFRQAVKWKIFAYNPANDVEYVKNEKEEKIVWDIKTAKEAIKACDNFLLKLVLNILIACTLRFGELRGLSWDCMDISKKAINNQKAFIYVNKQVQRVKKEDLGKVAKKEVLLVFPEKRKSANTILVLKKLKTQKSVRKIYIPKTVAMLLCEWKEEQNRVKEIMGTEYKDYNLVFADYNGLPMGDSKIRNAFSEFIKKNNLPKVDLHSLRHLSISYKLKLTNGDIKSTQGDSGHAQANMVTDTYAHIFDDDRRGIALLFEENFYAD